ncbi:MAG: SsgA family sporulation/cell division regulator [Nocardioidaceae bacterium]|nr:SsgA family sporulation/cell division regulator [Nocardioidaceae bacterium]
MQPRSSTVQATLVLELLDAEGVGSPVQAELRYDSGDPFAVRGDFCLAEQLVRWVFARSLLRTGLWEPTGAGDVRVRPGLNPEGCAVVHIELSSPDGAAVLEARAGDVAAFLRRTESLVPPGCESAHVDVDRALSRLLDQPA